MLTIRRSYKFPAAHLLLGHPKCGRLHGHNYVVEVTLEPLQGANRMSDGMVIDFGKMDQILKPYFDRLDHRLIVSGEMHNDRYTNPYALIAIDNGDAIELNVWRSTCENMAVLFLREIETILLNIVQPVEVTVHEIDNGCATAHKYA